MNGCPHSDLAPYARVSCGTPLARMSMADPGDPSQASVSDLSSASSTKRLMDLTDDDLCSILGYCARSAHDDTLKAVLALALVCKRWNIDLPTSDHDMSKLPDCLETCLLAN